MSNSTCQCSIWQTWSSWKAENQTDSPLLSDVLIRSVPPLAVNDTVYSICIAPQLDLVTIVISTTPEHKMNNAWKEYSYEGMTVGMDSCWGDIVCADPFLIKDIMAKLPQKYSNVSFVGVGGGAAVATLCGLCAPQHTSASISVYSFGAPRLGGGSMVQLYRRLINEGRLRILSFVNVCDTVTRRPNGWWNLRSGYHTVGRAVYFSSKVKGMHGYWQHLQNWEAIVPFEEWFKVEEARRRWSKKWIVVLFILAIYTPIVLLTLVSPGLRTFKALITRESPSVILSTPATLKKEGWIDVQKVSEIACEAAARNVSHQPVAKAQAESRETVEKNSEKTKETEEEDAEVVSLGLLHVELGKAVNFDIVVRHDSVDRGIQTPSSSPNSTDKTVLSAVPIVHAHDSGAVSAVNNELLVVDEVAQSNANTVDNGVLESIKSPQGLTIPMEGEPETNVTTGAFDFGGENMPRMSPDANSPELNEVEEIIDAGGQDSSLGWPPDDVYIHVPQVAAFDDDLATDVKYGVSRAERLYGAARDEDVGEDADSSLIVSLELSEPGHADEENPAFPTFSDEKSVESDVATIFPLDLELGVVIDENELPSDLLDSYEDQGILRTIGVVADHESPHKSLKGELVVEDVEASDTTGTESLAPVAETSDCSEPDGTQLREVSGELMPPEDEILEVLRSQDDLDTVRDEKSTVAVAQSPLETGLDLPGRVVESVHLGDAIVDQDIVETAGCDFEEELVTATALEVEALGEPNASVDEDSSTEHGDAIDQEVELDALAMPNPAVDDESSREHRDAVDRDAFLQVEELDQQSMHDAHDFQNEKATTMDAIKVDDTELEKFTLRADGVQTNDTADVGDASLIGIDPEGQPSGHDPEQSQPEPESDPALEIGSNSDSVRRSYLFGTVGSLEGDTSSAFHERIESQDSKMDTQRQEVSTGPQASYRPWGSRFDKSLLARSNRMKPPPPLLLELDVSVMESQLQRRAVNRVFDRWETMNWWKSQAANRLDTEAAATAIVREAFLRSGVQLND